MPGKEVADTAKANREAK